MLLYRPFGSLHSKCPAGAKILTFMSTTSELVNAAAKVSNVFANITLAAPRYNYKEPSHCGRVSASR
ncbi:MAG TPA: hypothetical protein VL866_20295 [Pyrinomonadaceae bacterium]|nr:hypothetical protein [Pyrinomonadaceae bacterium]